jgi:hypothetical protein
MVNLMCMFLLIVMGVGPDVLSLVEKLDFSFRHCLLYARIVFLCLPVGSSMSFPFS